MQSCVPRYNKTKKTIQYSCQVPSEQFIICGDHDDECYDSKWGQKIDSMFEYRLVVFSKCLLLSFIQSNFVIVNPY